MSFVPQLIKVYEWSEPYKNEYYFITFFLPNIVRITEGVCI